MRQQKITLGEVRTRRALARSHPPAGPVWAEGEEITTFGTPSAKCHGSVIGSREWKKLPPI